MNAKERIEEAHGLWELAVVRVALLAEIGINDTHMAIAIREERNAFRHWENVSRSALNSVCESGS